jgi:hypothetical protein
MTSVAVAYAVSSTRMTASSGSPCLPRASRNTDATATFERNALEEPRSITAFPAFTHRPAASLVTLGRFS